VASPPLRSEGVSTRGEEEEEEEEETSGGHSLGVRSA